MIPKLPADVVALQERMVALRRDLHAHPEIAHQEHATAERVVAYLEGGGLDVRTGVGGTGVVATAAGEGPRTVLLRVDLDALPVQERSDAPYASRVPGVMHACGHDGHAAMGATAARVLAGRALPGTVRVLFQPAEEGAGGAAAVLNDGVLEGVDVAVGLHLWNEMPVGRIGVKAGPLMAAVDKIRIVVRGRGGHGAMPQRSADPVVAAAHVVTALQTIVSRGVSPLDSAVVTIGSIHGGEAFNVIPGEVTLEGTVRTFDAGLRRTVAERLRAVATGVAGGLDCRAEVEIEPGNPAVVNDPRIAEVARAVAGRVVGEANVAEPRRTMGGEDMSLYLERVPGCYVFIGSANAERGLTEPHHSPSFDFDEDALSIGCAFLVEAAMELLKS
jgi:amidohydrolase